jgi:hypothetical protein
MLEDVIGGACILFLYVNALNFLETEEEKDWTHTIRSVLIYVSVFTALVILWN